MLDDALFNKFRELIHRTAGISLSDEKKELLTARLSKRLRACGLTSFAEYYRLITSDQAGEEFTHFINSVSTNYTSFFREQAHFTALTERLLPSLDPLVTAGRRPLMVWSSACSSGEEPYTLAMVLNEYYRGRKNAFQILATDISTRVLNIARRGIYAIEQVNTVPQTYLKRYFMRGVGRSAGYVKVKPILQEHIRFQQFNLMDRFPWRHEMHIIFCRNVMIYFDRPTQQRLVNKFYDCLVAGGYLVIGHSESISSIEHRFQLVEATIFRK